MKLCSGDMWLEKPEIFLVTGNNTVNMDGALVMGRGAARFASIAFPNCAYSFGSEILKLRRNVRNSHQLKYGVLVFPSKPILGLFQVKYHYRDHARLEIIQYSVQRLRNLISINETWKKRIVMNFPGIGWGGLQREAVLPLLEPLPDNVEIWEAG